MINFRAFIKSKTITEAKISMDQIHDGQGILDHDTVKKYKEHLKSGGSLKPVILRPTDKKTAKKTGKAYYIYDGSHRYHAHKQENRTHIDAHVADSDEDAETYQVGQKGR